MESATLQSQNDLESLVRRHQAGVWRYVRLLGVDPVDADDLTQDVFLILIRKGFVAADEASTWSFLRQTARFLVLRRRRAWSRSREEARTELVDQVWDEQEDPTGEAWARTLHTCLERLEGRSREAVRLFYREGRSRSEVAHCLAMKENGVKTLLQRTRAWLRKCVQGTADIDGGRP